MGLDVDPDITLQRRQMGVTLAKRASGSQGWTVVVLRRSANQFRVGYAEG